MRDSEQTAEQLKTIVDAFRLLKETDPEWLKGIENRPTGSQWGVFMPWERLALMDWVLLPDSQKVPVLHQPECLYFRCTSGIPETAYENIKLLSEFEDYKYITIEKGVHGVELTSIEVQPRWTKEAWLILGPYKQAGVLTNKKLVYTAYPETPAASIIKHPLWDNTYNCLSAIARSKIPIAVKGLK